MIAELSVLAIIIYLFYFFFIKGTIYPILLFAFGVYGGKLLILHFFPTTIKTVMTFLSYEISWAAFIAGIITVLGIGYLMEDK